MPRFGLPAGNRSNCSTPNGLSSVAAYADHDGAVGNTRKSITTRKVAVDTINPTELLDRFNAPAMVEYLSLDVEGCELDVLGSFDFQLHKVAVLTVEHSEVAEKQASIRAVLEPKGYRVVTRHYDDWFFHPEYVTALGGDPDGEAILHSVAKTHEIKEL